MNRRQLIAVAVLGAAALVIAVWAWSNRLNGWSMTNDPPQVDGPIVAFGDSLTHGYGARDGESYVDILSSLVGRPIIAKGYPTETSEDGVRRLDEVLALNPRIAIVFFGGNDILKGKSRDALYDNVKAIAEALQERGALVVIVGIDGFALMGSGYEIQLRRAAEDTGSVFVPNAMDGIIGKPALMSDPIHPNTEGYRIMAAHVYEHAGDYLKEIVTTTRTSSPSGPASRTAP